MPRAGAPVLTRELAIAECIQYIRHCAAVRRFDDPDDPERLHAYATALVDEVSVTEAFNLIYLAARSAADWKAKYPVNTQQAGSTRSRSNTFSKSLPPARFIDPALRDLSQLER